MANDLKVDLPAAVKNLDEPIKIGGRKIPKYALIAGGGAVIVGFVLLTRKGGFGGGGGGLFAPAPPEPEGGSGLITEDTLQGAVSFESALSDTAQAFETRLAEERAATSGEIQSAVSDLGAQIAGLQAAPFAPLPDLPLYPDYAPAPLYEPAPPPSYEAPALGAFTPPPPAAIRQLISPPTRKPQPVGVPRPATFVPKTSPAATRQLISPPTRRPQPVGVPRPATFVPKTPPAAIRQLISPPTRRPQPVGVPRPATFVPTISPAAVRARLDAPRPKPKPAPKPRPMAPPKIARRIQRAGRAVRRPLVSSGQGTLTR